MIQSPKKKHIDRLERSLKTRPRPKNYKKRQIHDWFHSTDASVNLPAWMVKALQSKRDMMNALTEMKRQVTEAEIATSRAVDTEAQFAILLDNARHTAHRLSAEIEALKASKENPAPVPMILFCPMCTARHIDEGDFATKSHHAHSCQACGFTWRPAVVPTVGVLFLPGFKS